MNWNLLKFCSFLSMTIAVAACGDSSVTSSPADSGSNPPADTGVVNPPADTGVADINRPPQCREPGDCEGQVTPGECRVTECREGRCLIVAAADGTPCQTDELACTDDRCTAGVCTHPTTSTACLIEGNCYEDGMLAPTEPCQYCDAVFAQDRWRKKPAGLPCDDGDPATIEETCSESGQCLAPACECRPGDECCEPTCLFSAVGTPCASDELSCTSDACERGACRHPVQAGWCLIGGVCYSDGASHPANSCAYCDSVFSREGWRNKVDGTGCNDGDRCTRAETCNAGSCQGGEPLVCQPRDDCHTAGVCNPLTGACSEPAKPDGAPCTLDSPGPDHCVDGLCLPEACSCPEYGGVCCDCEPINVGGACPDEGIACTSDRCGAAGTCEHTILPGFCLVDGVCFEDGADHPDQPCQWCQANLTASAWTVKPADTACDDHDACTLLDTCVGLQCVGRDPIRCEAVDACHIAGVCDPATGRCSEPAQPDNHPCSDGDLCTRTDTCQGGICRGRDSLVCADPPAGGCQLPGSCVEGVCVYPDKQDEAPCDDGNATTVNDQCRDGLCLGAGVTCVNEASICCEGGLLAPGKLNAACNDDRLACTAGKCNASGVCDEPLAAGNCLINGICYANGTQKPGDHCFKCDASNPRQWTPSRLAEVACNQRDDDCDGRIDEDSPWPAADPFEPNDSWAPGFNMGFLPGLNFTRSPNPTGFHFQDGGDYFFWTYDHRGGEVQWWWICRVLGLRPGQQVHLWFGFNYGPYPGGGMNSVNYWSDPLTHDAAYGSLFLTNIKQGGYAFGSGVIPSQGFDACRSTYQLECQLSSDGAWH